MLIVDKIFMMAELGAINHDRGRSFHTEVEHYMLTLCKYHHYLLTELLRPVICGLACSAPIIKWLTWQDIKKEGEGHIEREGSWQVSLVLWLDWSRRLQRQIKLKDKGRVYSWSSQYHPVDCQVDIQMRVNWPGGDCQVKVFPPLLSLKTSSKVRK